MLEASRASGSCPGFGGRSGLNQRILVFRACHHASSFSAEKACFFSDTKLRRWSSWTTALHPPELWCKANGPGMPPPNSRAASKVASAGGKGFFLGGLFLFGFRFRFCPLLLLLPLFPFPLPVRPSEEAEDDQSESSSSSDMARVIAGCGPESCGP